MTDTTTGTEHGSEATLLASTGTWEHLDSQSLALETNVRDDADLDAEFLASIKELGVVNPIVTLRGEDGVVRVRAGSAAPSLENRRVVSGVVGLVPKSVR